MPAELRYKGKDKYSRDLKLAADSGCTGVTDDIFVPNSISGVLDLNFFLVFRRPRCDDDCERRSDDAGFSVGIRGIQCRLAPLAPRHSSR